jgi:hypothetical protein
VFKASKITFAASLAMRFSVNVLYMAPTLMVQVSRFKGSRVQVSKVQGSKVQGPGFNGSRFKGFKRRRCN